MKASIERDLTDACDAVEHLAKLWPTLKLAEKVDICARLKGAGKSIEQMDKDVKEDVKTKLKHKGGTVLGELFKAILTLVDTKRLDQKSLRLADPQLFNIHNKDATDERVTFEPR